jgi:hypothetical protein
METMRVVVLNRVRVEGLGAARKVAAPFPSPSSPASVSPAGVPDGPDLDLLSEANPANHGSRTTLKGKYDNVCLNGV